MEPNVIFVEQILDYINGIHFDPILTQESIFIRDFNILMYILDFRTGNLTLY